MIIMYKNLQHISQFARLLCFWFILLGFGLYSPLQASAQYTKTWSSNTDWASASSHQNVAWTDVSGQIQLVKEPPIVHKTPFIYIPNSGSNNVTQLDTKTGKVLWTFNLNQVRASGFPSRTTVDVNGDVWVGLRGGSEVVWISQQGTLKKVVQTGRVPRAITLDLDGNVWVGNWQDNTVVKIDGKTGNILLTVSNVACPYGAVADIHNNIWVVNNCNWDNANTLTRLNKNGQVLSRIPAAGAYGIATDKDGQIWAANWPGSCVHRFNNQGSSLGCIALSARPRGVAIDANSNAWVPCSHINTTETQLVVKLSPTGQILGRYTDVGRHSIGTAVDADGFVWVISYSQNQAVKINTNTGTTAAKYSTGGVEPYTYSDMTGFAFQSLSKAAEGYWRGVHNSQCVSRWQSISWKAHIPANTSLTVRARTASSRTALNNASWSAAVSNGGRPNVVDNTWIEIEVAFKTADSQITPYVTELSVVSVPTTTEICNGIDDDCDGYIDNVPGTKQNNNLTRSCNTACGSGTETCVNGKWANCTATKPQTERCNGRDDDCNGIIDDPWANQKGKKCSVGVGACQRTGVYVCLADGSGVQCSVSGGSPTPEICDGIDNDCNGQIDDGLMRPCQTACGSGIETCNKGVWGGCTARQPQPETCNNQDDDCDGQVDNGLTRTCKTACGKGTEVCISGRWVNCDAQQPQPEVCDGTDNDCNGQIDDGIPPRKCMGDCGEGLAVCLNGKWSGCSGPTPEPEICDGKDNDCNGLVDDGLFRTCHSACGAGKETCQNGQWVGCNAPQPQPEICNGKDDDCDGVADNGAPCPAGMVCDQGACRLLCRNLECPSGMLCVDGYCQGDACSKISCPGGKTCIAGRCIDPCELVNCPDGTSCQNGQCLKDDCYLRGCPNGQRCINGFCQNDPCQNVTCPDGQFCRDGQCIDSCAKIKCADKQRCVDGKCIDDPTQTGACDGVNCPDGHFCSEGKCLADPCYGVTCPSGRQCRNGVCEHDVCHNIKCPEGQICRDGQCFSTKPDQPSPELEHADAERPYTAADAGSSSSPDRSSSIDHDHRITEIDYIYDRNSGTPQAATDAESNRYQAGCSCNAYSPASLPLLILPLFLLLLLFHRKRKTL
jgi:streptogramin lyase